ncbi:bifunctional [glutamine synthetase] adenylyltransferase/[glutamine synthetase]-adenylyl-L-tyrosine phosphorylase [Kribbella sp. CA-293567]|uniref:bifunctional [glutamine synthetase] adenylyltransferase/[glutamine synthetase]-adenylyl-L-tyrosine phosphorylase n=1 Tax=Kribbella sp. CA-293567 TaxID=3002436 RepID=UPI0022DE5BCD|nr:bifunctional [glutamine synthetase] adenylyltransferase/[glutamine synthetase]-adenylyl-L-tyrosine phosphorylase [Kribbella sp. CA-293567]WBQ02822.1 bifunctional [glutamine synthetase] adenylyltransferase/[glutamine synthetase]-adenylyl-L-tyrosine phosphorylase [Kribbella sp. CA-293567]
MAEVRRVSGAGRLARAGFADSARAGRMLDELDALDALSAPGEYGPMASDQLIASLSESADPDLALCGLLGIAESLHANEFDLAAFARTLDLDADFRRRLIYVLGASEALGRHLSVHPRHWYDLADPALAASRPTPDDVAACLATAVDAPNPTDALRVEYRRLLLRLAARDLAEGLLVDETAAVLADLAGGALQTALQIARNEYFAAHPKAADCRLAIVAMGKCGGRELNYVSDVDVLFVAEPLEGQEEAPALKTATALASATMRICSAQTAEGTLWPVDAALRPEGKAGPLVRTLDSHLAYYQRWAKTWEFQALLKARAVAGDAELGELYAEKTRELVWSAADREGFVGDVQAMRRRVVDHIPAADADRQLKLGPGGLRDVEFAVQLLQLVHGRSDESVRSGTTLIALEQLTTCGYVGRTDGAVLADAYRFLRSMEHRIQLYRLRRTHQVPDDDDDLRRLGRSLGFTKNPIDDLMTAWKKQGLEVRRLHEKLFYRPLLAAVARIPGEEVRLTPEAAKQRLTALGYADPGSALRHIEALSEGVSRRSSIQRALLPAMLGWFAESPDPDAGLLAFRTISDSLGSTPWYLRQLRDEGASAERLAHLLASGRYAVDLLQRAPEATAMLADERELAPRALESLLSEMSAAGRRQDEPVAAVAAIRGARRRELFRIAASDLSGLLEVEAVGEALTTVSVATLTAALEVARRTVAKGEPEPTRMSIVAMGRFGGHELSYGSDADVMFVHDPVPGASEKAATDFATQVASELRRLLALPGADPAVAIDADLRPEGRQGPLVRTLASYASYYARWSAVWEAQALLRADPLCGDPELCDAFRALIDPLRYPEGGISDRDVLEIRRIKARVDAERLPRGADPATHTKLGRGGLADIEWTVQLLQMRYAHRIQDLRTTRTLGTLRAAVDVGLVEAPDADVLCRAWEMATRIRNAIMLVRARPGDSLPRDPRDLAAVAQICGYNPGETSQFSDDYRRRTRQARNVVDRLFWGD